MNAASTPMSMITGMGTMIRSTVTKPLGLAIRAMMKIARPGITIIIRTVVKAPPCH